MSTPAAASPTLSQGVKINSMFTQQAPGKAAAKGRGKSAQAAESGQSSGVQDVPASVLLAHVGDLVAALSRKPDYAKIVSPIDSEREQAMSVASELISVSAQSVDIVHGMGFTGATRAINTVIAEAWTKGKPAEHILVAVGAYAGTLKESSERYAIPLDFGFPRLSVLSSTGAERMMAITSGVKAIYPGLDKNLHDWFVKEIIQDKQEQLPKSIQQAVSWVEQSPQLQFMSNKAFDIIAMSAAAVISHANNVYDSVEFVLKDQGKKVFGSREDFVSIAIKNVLQASVDAVEDIEVSSTPDDIDIAQGIAGMMTYMSKPWLNLRINTLREVSGLKKDSVTTEVINQITRKYVEQAIPKRQLLLDVIKNTTPETLAADIKTRGTLVSSGFQNVELIEFVENAIKTAELAHLGALKPASKSKIPSLKAVAGSNENAGVESATLRSVLRKVAATLPHESTTEEAAKKLLLSMDGIKVMTGMNVSGAKKALEAFVQEHMPINSWTDEKRASIAPEGALH